MPNYPNIIIAVVAVAAAIGLYFYGTATCWTFQADGCAAENYDPAWSPDGVRIAFTSTRDKNEEIYLVNVQSLETTRVTTHAGIDEQASWTPGGELIAHASNQDSQKGKARDIYSMHPIVQNVSRLTFRAQGRDIEPSWTPTQGAAVSKTIVFASDRDGNLEIYSLNSDTLSVTRLTFREQNEDRHPTISPDGTRIAFQSLVDGNWEIFIMDSDGRNTKQLTFNPGEDFAPAFSPDGSTIAFTSNRDTNDEIYTMSVDGSNVVNLSRNDENDSHPTWSPDSQRIAFQSDRSGTYEIYVMNAADGTEQQQLTGLE